MTPQRTSTFRSCVCETSREVALFVCDVLSQPHYHAPWKQPDPLAHTKAARALPLARSEDIVVLGGPAPKDYLNWLYELGLGPRSIVSLPSTSDENASTVKLLAERIEEGPEEIIEALRSAKRPAVYVPFYAGRHETQAAHILGIPLLGSVEETALRFFNKETFKQECQALGIPIVGGASHEVSGDSQGAPSSSELEQVVSALLGNHSSVIVRHAMGGAGSQIYRAESLDVRQVIKGLQDSRPGRVLIEPFLKVIAAPNDQWCITRSRRAEHIGMSVQLFDGLRHIGNLKGQYLSDRVSLAIHQSSEKIAQRMAQLGYRGLLSIDYLVSEQGIFPIQNNARMNGSTFAFGIVENLERLVGSVACWKFLRGSLEVCGFDELASKISPVLFDGIRKNSVFVFDTDSLKVNGSVGLLLLGEDMYHISYLESALKELGVSAI